MQSADCHVFMWGKSSRSFAVRTNPWIIAESVEGTLVTFYDWFHAGEEINLYLFKSIRSFFIFDVVNLSEQTEAVTKQAKYMWQLDSYVQPLNSDTCWAQCLCKGSRSVWPHKSDVIWHYKSNNISSKIYLSDSLWQFAKQLSIKIPITPPQKTRTKEKLLHWLSSGIFLVVIRA